MFATMVVCLPSVHEGGEVVVSFGDVISTLSTSQHSEWNTSYMAWYSNVLHEVRPVRSGARIVLTYNLVYRGQQEVPNPVKLEEDKVALRQTLKTWRDEAVENDKLPAYLAYPFEHEYSVGNITLTHLKRRDKARALCASQVADELGMDCLLAVISKTETREEDEEEDSEKENDIDIDCKILYFEGRVLLDDVALPQSVLATKNAWPKAHTKKTKGSTRGTLAWRLHTGT